MSSAAVKLKELRKSASPPITVRAMAEELGVPFGTYSTYEAASRYKKPTLPLELTRRVADVLAKRNVDPVEVMKLAGLTASEAEPEARAIEAARPQVQYVPLQLALPSEDALFEMFHSLLAYVPENASRDEAARTLAQRLPAGLAAVGPAVLALGSAGVTGAGAIPQAPARGHPSPSHESRT